MFNASNPDALSAPRVVHDDSGVLVYEGDELQVYIRRMPLFPGDPVPSDDELERMALAELAGCQ